MSDSPGGAEPAAFSSRNTDLADMSAIQEFIDEGVVASVLNVVKSGKEATVYRCRAGRKEGRRFVAVKVYHGSAFRNFGNATVYNDGVRIGNGQVRRAVEGKTEFGREAAAAIWVNREFDTLSALYDVGADVPEPLYATDHAILMEYIGGDHSAAVQLQYADFDPGQAAAAFDRLLWNIELWMANNYIHADLSAYNVLAWQGRVTVIDFPQAVDPRFNRAARSLLERDIRNVTKYFRRHGIDRDPEALTRGLWWRWQNGRL